MTSGLPYGAGETFFVPEIREIQRRGHRVTVVPIRPRRSVVHADARPLIGTAIAAPVLSLSIVGSALAEVARAPKLAVRSALVVVTSRNVRLLLKNLAVLPKGLWLARVARRQGVDHIHASWAGTSATAALVASAVSGVPWSFTAHNWDIPEDNLLEEKARAATFVRAIDLRGRQELEGLIAPHRPKLRLIHVGVAPAARGPEREKRSPGPLRVLLGARLDEEKGHRYALEAMARLKAAGVDASLHCAGDGPLRARVETYAAELDVRDRVQFLGLVDHQELLSQLGDRRWDVALLPSLETREQREGIPVFLIEAMGAGIPVVATATGGIPELLEGGAGMLVPQRDARAIAEALARLAADDNLRRRLADAGMRRVRAEFTIEATVSALLEEIDVRGPA